MQAEIDEDVEAFRRRLDTIVRDAFSEQRQGVGIIEEIIEFEPFVFDIETGRPEILYKGPRGGGFGACCFNDTDPDNPCHPYPNQTLCEADGGTWRGGPCDPNPCNMWACCYDDFCLMQLEVECGGDFKLGQSCSETDICPTGACCFDGYCASNYSEFRCNNETGIYKGDGTVCSPNPCPNACCLPDDGGCVTESEEDCTIAGGTFQGVGSVCGICGCTDPAACNYDPTATLNNGCKYIPGVTVVCDISYASGSKCGFQDIVTGKYYLTQTATTSSSGTGSGSSSCNASDSGPPNIVSVAVSWSYSWTKIEVSHYTDTSCTTSEDSCNITGSISVDHDGPHTGNCATLCVASSSILPSCGLPDDTNFGLSYNGIGGFYYVNVPGCGRLFAGTGSVSTVLSDEYTTAMLISKVEGDLPPFSGEFLEGGCASSRFLSSDEVTYSEQNCQYKLVFPDVDIAFDVTWNEHFVPATGSPSDTPKSASFPAHTTESGVYFLDHPSTNGTITITDVVVTCA